ncbi:unnamed protein product [Phaeothamnion confervicola]
MESDPAIPFPFEPYPVQADLMRKLYSTLEKGGVGIFESPTGTGKSLSVICSALQWLKDTEAKDLLAPAKDDNGGGASEAKATAAASGVPDWLASYSKDKKKRERDFFVARRKLRRHELEQRLAEVRTQSVGWDKRRWTRRRDTRAIGGGKRAPPAGKKAVKDGAANLEDEESDRKGGAGATKGRKRRSSAAAESAEDAFFLDEYHSSDGDEAAAAAAAAGSRRNRCARLGGTDAGGGSDSDDDDDPRAREQRDRDDAAALQDLGVRQVLYCSRTHSQTAQFVNEVKKTAFAAGVRCVSLGSRRNLCINPDVRRLAGDTRITDACLDLQKKSPRPGGPDGNCDAGDGGIAAKKRRADCAVGKGHGGGSGGGAKTAAAAKRRSGGCPYMSADGQRNIRDHALATVRDIEELADLGERLEACPYYGVRAAVPWAQLVVMPYAVLLQRQSRESMGVSLQGAAVIIDEAHNLVEAINDTHSVR